VRFVILGILSDTHGQAARCGRAVALLKQLRAEAFVHCGDVGGEGVFDALAGLRCWFVWGNTDVPSAGMQRYAETIGLSPPRSSPVRVELAGRTIAVFHGHESGFSQVWSLASRGDGASLSRYLDGAAYVLYGHTHEAADARVGPVRLINPGALHRARPHTVATLDLQSDVLEHWIVDDNAPLASRPRLFKLA
jgi:putative phosphoesterase